MIRIQNILVPLDFSEASKRAVNYGLSLALEFEARLILAHIAPYDTAAYEKAKANLLELIPRDCRERLTFEILVRSGDVHSELGGMVEDREIDLVVMGTRGRSYFERMLLGSVTERMLRKLHVPVLTVSHLDPEKEIHTPGPVTVRRILYATDLADGSEEGLDFWAPNRVLPTLGLDVHFFKTKAVKGNDSVDSPVARAAHAHEICPARAISHLVQQVEDDRFEVLG